MMTRIGKKLVELVLINRIVKEVIRDLLETKSSIRLVNALNDDVTQNNVPSDDVALEHFPIIRNQPAPPPDRP